MIPFEEAYKIVQDIECYPQVETVELNQSLNRTLAEDVVSDMFMPPFDKSTMDGYAFNIQDVENELDVIETVVAGSVPQKSIGKNECVEITTGAMLPRHANCVAMVENIEIADNGKVKIVKKDVKLNVVKRGEDVKVGDILLKKGIKIKSHHIAILAAVGYWQVKVSKQVHIAVIATGNELVEPEYQPQISQIRNSNSHQLIAQINEAGAIAHYFGIAKDEEKEINKLLEQAEKQCDIIILTGGVSMGKFDFVPNILKNRNYNILFHKVAVQPGKPILCAEKIIQENDFDLFDELPQIQEHSKKICFGLPGNPVSGFVQFNLLIKPLINKYLNAKKVDKTIRAEIATSFKRTRIERMAWIPVKFTAEGKVIPVEYHSSAHIFALSYADGLISIQVGQSIINEGDIVDVRPI